MHRTYLSPLSKKRPPATIGNKAQNLKFLFDQGYRVPKTWVCSWEAYQQYLQDDSALVTDLLAELQEIVREGCAYAVRSSANIEDAFEHSFAGQFKTYLNVQGLDEVLTSIWGVWSTAHSQSVQVYLKKRHFDPEKLRMAVIIQEMVHPVLSGVSFSRNPMTGSDEVVVEAVWGSGEALVQEGRTPFRWICRRGVWLARPEEEDVPLDLIREVIAQTERIARRCKKAVDLEWVFDGRDLYWVQLREINSIHKVAIYSNRISKEMMPGIIKPLIFSVNVPMVVGEKILLIKELTGRKDIDPSIFVKSFYYRSYFNMGEFGEAFRSLGLPEDALEMMLGMKPASGPKPIFKPGAKTLLLLPRLLPFLFDKLTFGRKIERFLTQVPARYKEFDLVQPGRLSETELLTTIERLFTLNQETTHFNFFVPLLSSVQNGLLRRQCRQADLVCEDYDPAGEGSDPLEHNPTLALRRLKQQFKQLPVDVQTELLAGDYAQFIQRSGIDRFKTDVEAFLERFGHLSDSTNDFSATPWRESPDLILKMVAYFPEGGNKPPQKPDLQNLPLKGYRRQRFINQYHRTSRYRRYRERVGFIYTYGYGLFRVFFLSLADRLVSRGVLLACEDIFYLTWDEIRAAVTQSETGCDYAKRVLQRKLEIEQMRDVTLPEIIYGERIPPPISSDHQKLTGTPTSRGIYTGPVQTVRGIQDFPKLRDGDVLVVPYSDVGWSPLFARAGAVIAESGGMLSHSSIIAREYGIPAVVSVAGALSLVDGTQVTVDGFTGAIAVHEGQD